MQVYHDYSFVLEHLLTQHAIEDEAKAKKVAEEMKEEQAKENERLLQEEKENN